MLKKLAFAALSGSLLIASVPASARDGADGAFPKDNSNDYSIGVAMSDGNSPFPKDNSNDYSISVAMSDDSSPFPKDNSTDYGTAPAAA